MHFFFLLSLDRFLKKKLFPFHSLVQYRNMFEIIGDKEKENRKDELQGDHPRKMFLYAIKYFAVF